MLNMGFSWVFFPLKPINWIVDSHFLMELMELMGEHQHVLKIIRLISWLMGEHIKTYLKNGEHIITYLKNGWPYQNIWKSSLIYCVIPSTCSNPLDKPWSVMATAATTTSKGPGAAADSPRHQRHGRCENRRPGAAGRDAGEESWGSAVPWKAWGWRLSGRDPPMSWLMVSLGIIKIANIYIYDYIYIYIYSGL